MASPASIPELPALMTTTSPWKMTCTSTTTTISPPATRSSRARRSSWGTATATRATTTKNAVRNVVRFFQPESAGGIRVGAFAVVFLPVRDMYFPVAST